MSQVAFHKVTKILGGVAVLDRASFSVPRDTKVGLIGENGSGKSTILRLITGTLQPDSGDLSVARSALLGYLPQTADCHSELTALEEALSARPHVLEAWRRLNSLQTSDEKQGQPSRESALAYAETLAEFYELSGDQFEREARESLEALGLAQQIELPMHDLSGGERSRVALVRTLLVGASILVLDEPDNHLDTQGVVWLENALRRYRGTLILVTHDRELLDHVVAEIIEIEHGKTTMQKGNCTDYLSRKRQQLERQMQDYLDQQKRVRKLKEAIHEASCKALKIENETKNFHYRKRALKVARRAVVVKRRIERELEGEKSVERPTTTRDAIKVDLAPARWDERSVLHLVGVSKSFGQRVLFRDVNLSVSRGQRIALLGPNGAGKTTLMEIALGIQPADDGDTWLSRGASVFYCDQEHAGLDPELSVYDTLAKDTELSHNQIHYLLAKLLFKRDAVFKHISQLSGGEASRLVLALLANSRADLLMLDEPTNHLDLAGIETLQKALASFPGAVVLISHDRRLVREVATESYEIRDARLQRLTPRESREAKAVTDAARDERTNEHKEARARG